LPACSDSSALNPMITFPLASASEVR